MNNHKQLFESVYCDLYEDIHAGFIIDFQNEIYPLLEELRMLQDLEEASHNFVLFESSQNGTQELDFKTINTIFKAASKVSDNKTKTKLLDKIGTKFKDLIKKYKDIRPTKKIAEKANEAVNMILSKDDSLKPLIDKVESFVMNDTYANIALAVLMAAAFAIGTGINNSESISDVLKTSIDVMSSGGSPSEINQSIKQM